MALSKTHGVASFIIGVSLLLCNASGPSCAQNDTPRLATTPPTYSTPFLSSYRDYVDATNQDEANGLHKVAVPDFAIRDDYLGKTLRGDEAFVYAKKVYDGTKNNVGHSIRFRVAKQTDQYAVIYAEETISTIDDVKDSLTPEQFARVRAKGLKTTSKSTATWDWKHTWRKTPQGWKLASLARDDRSDAERHAETGKVFYVGVKPSVDLTTTQTDK